MIIEGMKVFCGEPRYLSHCVNELMHDFLFMPIISSSRAVGSLCNNTTALPQTFLAARSFIADTTLSSHCFDNYKL